MKRHALIPSLLAICLALLPSEPAEAGGAVGIHVGGAGFGFSFTAGDWAPYGAAWSDPGWRYDLDLTLGSYGDWIWVDGLGRVWRPSVAASWRPYTNGRWVWTSYGWTWVAYEPWGYLPHHYGSWAFSSYGWVWTPGWQYSPANVVWVGHGDWIGWYPCGPAGWSHAARGFRHGFHDGYRNGYRVGYGDGYDDGWRDASHATWTRWRHLGEDNVADWSAAPPDLGAAISRGRVRPLSTPPSLSSVRAAGARVVETTLERRAVEVDGRSVELVRPAGVTDSVRRHGVETVRAAQPEIAARSSRGEAPTLQSRRVADRPGVTQMPAMVRSQRTPLADSPPKPRVATVPQTGRVVAPRISDARDQRRAQDPRTPQSPPRPAVRQLTSDRAAPSLRSQPTVRPPAPAAKPPAAPSASRPGTSLRHPVPATRPSTDSRRDQSATSRAPRDDRGQRAPAAAKRKAGKADNTD